MTTIDEVLKIGKEKQRVFLVGFTPTGVGTCVAGRSGRVCLHEECVVVAI